MEGRVDGSLVRSRYFSTLGIVPTADSSQVAESDLRPYSPFAIHQFILVRIPTVFLFWPC